MLKSPKADDSSCFAWARFYGLSGFRVFPVGIDKKPLVKWKSEATSNVEKIKEWFCEKFPSAGIGLCTGAVGMRSGVFVIDCDSVESFKFVKDCLGPVSWNTLAVKSGRKDGGFHLYYRYDITKDNRHFRNAADLLHGNPSGVDVRGDGGYIIAPPSMHASGNRYRWLDSVVDWHLMAYIPIEWDRHRDALKIFNPALGSEDRANPSELTEKAQEAVKMVSSVFIPDQAFRRQKYAENAIQGKLDDIATAHKGSRHVTAIKRATHALRLALDPNLSIDANSVCDAIFRACLTSGLGRSEANQIVVDAIRYAREKGTYTIAEWGERITEERIVK